MFNDIIIVRSGGDIGTAVVHKLYKSGFNKILILEIEKPQAIRRKVAFCEAVFDGRSCVEGVICEKVENRDGIHACWERGVIPVLVDAECSILKEIKPDVLIDAILAKRNLNTAIDMAPLTIGLGPGFTAGGDVHYVIETQRGHNLGRIIDKGCAEKNTGIPGIIAGYAEERILRAPASGTVKVIKDIGETVNEGDAVMYVGEMPVISRITGAVRGCIRDGSEVSIGMKIGDVDPRNVKESCRTISDKARCIAGGVLEAVLSYKSRLQ